MSVIIRYHLENYSRNLKEKFHQIQTTKCELSFFRGLEDSIKLLNILYQKFQNQRRTFICSQLPTKLLFYIFSYLPIKSIPGCRRVSDVWLRTFTVPLAQKFVFKRTCRKRDNDKRLKNGSPLQLWQPLQNLSLNNPIEALPTPILAQICACLDLSDHLHVWSLVSRQFHSILVEKLAWPRSLDLRRFPCLPPSFSIYLGKFGFTKLWTPCFSPSFVKSFEPSLSQLEKLDIERPITYEVLEKISKLTNLRSLHITNGVQDGKTFLQELVPLKNLTEFATYARSFTVEDLCYLKHLPLVSLSLCTSSSSFGCSFRPLFILPLKSLVLSGWTFQIDDIKQLVHNFPNLYYLGLLSCNIPVQSICYLRQLKNLYGLEFKICNPEIAKKFQILINHLTTLKYLKLYDGSILQMNDLKNLTHLRKLDINHVNDLTLQCIGQLSVLTHLSISPTHWDPTIISDQGLTFLKGLTKLEVLQINYGRNISAQGVEQLRCPTLKTIVLDGIGYNFDVAIQKKAQFSHPVFGTRFLKGGGKCRT